VQLVASTACAGVLATSNAMLQKISKQMLALSQSSASILFLNIKHASVVRLAHSMELLASTCLAWTGLQSSTHAGCRQWYRAFLGMGSFQMWMQVVQLFHGAYLRCPALEASIAYVGVQA
jgi:hypothetical protein